MIAIPNDVALNLIIFFLATFLGIELVRHVSRLLHTPLMALTNAISSVSIVAALIVLSDPKNDLVLLLAVSYTHLDVYKRQRLWCLSFAPNCCTKKCSHQPTRK